MENSALQANPAGHAPLPAVNCHFYRTGFFLRQNQKNNKIKVKYFFVDNSGNLFYSATFVLFERMLRTHPWNIPAMTEDLMNRKVKFLKLVHFKIHSIRPYQGIENVVLPCPNRNCFDLYIQDNTKFIALLCFGWSDEEVPFVHDYIKRYDELTKKLQTSAIIPSVNKQEQPEPERVSTKEKVAKIMMGFERRYSVLQHVTETQESARSQTDHKQEDHKAESEEKPAERVEEQKTDGEEKKPEEPHPEDEQKKPEEETKETTERNPDEDPFGEDNAPREPRRDEEEEDKIRNLSEKNPEDHHSEDDEKKEEKPPKDVAQVNGGKLEEEQADMEDIKKVLGGGEVTKAGKGKWYTGDLKGDVPHGKGKEYTPKEHLLYTGEFREGKWHGFGSLKNVVTGDSNEGEFINGFLVGI